MSLLQVLCVLAVALAQQSGTEHGASRALLEHARRTAADGDHAAARRAISTAIDRTIEELGAGDTAPQIELLGEMGAFAHDLGEFRAAIAARTRVADERSRTLADHDLRLQQARLDLAISMKAHGDWIGARAVEEKMVDVWTRTLRGDARDLQVARMNLAATLHSLGDPAAARALEEKVVEVFTRTLPDDHPDLQTARLNLAVSLKDFGEFAGARKLEEEVVDVFSRTLPDDHPYLQTARANLADTLRSLGDLKDARLLEEKVLDVRTRTLPDDHPDVQSARVSLATTCRELGDLPRARTILEMALNAFRLTLPEDHPDVTLAREGLGTTLGTLGDLAGARVLFEQALAVRSRTLPDDHPNLQNARQNLATTLARLGDLVGARALFEQVLAVRSRTHPDDDPALQGARSNLAAMLNALGDHRGARELFEKVLEVRSNTLPEDHPALQSARLNLAAAMDALGEAATARELQETALEVLSRTLPGDHPDVQHARSSVASSLKARGDLAAARALEEQVLEVVTRTLPDDHPDLQRARQSLATTLAHTIARGSPSTAPATSADAKSMRARCRELMISSCRSHILAARTAMLFGSREAASRCEELSKFVGVALSFADGLGALDPMPELEPACFELGETTRGASLTAAALTRRGASSPRYSRLREELSASSAALARLVRDGTTSEEFRTARSRRESAERELLDLATDASAAPFFDMEALADTLGARDRVVAYRRYARATIGQHSLVGESASAAPVERVVDSLCAFVVRAGAENGDPTKRFAVLRRVELGPIAPIEELVRARREAIRAGVERGVPTDSGTADVTEHGEELRALVFDPLRDELGDAERIVLVLDDVLHLVAIDALPADAQRVRRLGDLWRIETRASLVELLDGSMPGVLPGALLALGAPAFDARPLPPGTEDSAAPKPASPSAPHVAAILRDSAWSEGFGPLVHTGAEAREIGMLHDAAFGEGSIILEDRRAAREALESLAPKARWLHIATHGWFAPESIRSWQDSQPLDRYTGMGARLSGEEQVRGMSPMLLCGLALAGANLPENEVGRAPGLVTAEELAALDLSRCELAVLSACDTNVGERRAGQGVASLQRALQMAGARSVITSLWKVPDEATRELMVDFYRRLWIEKKPKWQALWEAKRKMRETTDERGSPRYSTRDWAAWVLTGAPD